MTDPAIERWLPILGYEGLYEVSDLGRVRSFPRQTRSGLRGGGLLKAAPKNRLGHLKVTLCKDGAHVTRDVHWLVARAFLGPCPAGQQARHGPNGTGDNSAANLCYGTPRENQADRLRDGTDLRGERGPGAILTWAQVCEIRRRYAAGGVTYASLGREFGVSGPTVGAAVRHRNWK